MGGCGLGSAGIARPREPRVRLLEAFPWDTALRYFLRDLDGSYGGRFREAARWLGIWEVLTAPQSPWQNAYEARLIRASLPRNT
jgi:hypothetical protein